MLHQEERGPRILVRSEGGRKEGRKREREGGREDGEGGRKGGRKGGRDGLQVCDAKKVMDGQLTVGEICSK